MRLCKIVCLPIWLMACLVQAAFPQCHQLSSASSKAESSLEDRTVLLTLIVGQSGRVRDVKVLSGPITLTAAAIEAAKARRYNAQIRYGRPNSREMTVAVKFPLDNNGAPTIQEVIIGGVPGCVSGEPMGYTPPPWSGVLPQSLNTLLRVQPIMPVLAPEPAK
jgi:hypothetical protein